MESEIAKGRRGDKAKGDKDKYTKTLL